MSNQVVDKVTEVLMKLDGEELVYYWGNESFSCCVARNYTDTKSNCRGDLFAVISRNRKKYAFLCEGHLNVPLSPGWELYE